MHYHHKVLHATSIRLRRYPIRQGLDEHNAISFSSLQFCLLLFYQSHQVFFIYLVWTVTTPGAVVFCNPFYSSPSGLLVSFQCPSSALFISSEHLPRWQVAGGGRVDVPWLPYTLLSFCLALIPEHPKLLTLTLCPRFDSPFGWLTGQRLPVLSSQGK